MAMETANSHAAALLPADLIDTGHRAALLRQGAPAMIVAGDGRQVLWASHAMARRLGAADGAGLMAKGLAPHTAGSLRLAALGRDPDPAAPARLERLRFNIGFRSILVTVLCAVIPLADGASALLVSLAEGGAESAAERPAPAMTETAAEMEPILPLTLPDAPEIPPVAPPVPADAAARPPEAGDAALPAWLARPMAERRPIRFVFALDAAGRVESVSPALAEAIGPAGATLAGEMLPNRIAAFDPGAAATIQTAIARGETFSGIALEWPLDGAGLAVPLDLSALPRHAAEGGLAGFSGFGRCHIERVAGDLPSPPAPPSAMAEPAAPGAPIPEPESGPIAETAAPTDTAGQAEIAFAEAEAADPAPIEALPATPIFEDAAPAEAESTALEAMAEAPAGQMPDSSRQEALPAPLPKPDNRPAAPGNVVALRIGQSQLPPPAPMRSGLSMSERNAFREIARALGAKFDPDLPGLTPLASPAMPAGPARDAGEPAEGKKEGQAGTARPPSPPEPAEDAETVLLDRLPIGILALKNEKALFANRTLLELTGYPDLATFHAEDGARAIFRKGAMPRGASEAFDTIVLATRGGEMIPVDAHLQIVEWHGTPATLISIRRAVELEQGKALRSVALDLKRERSEAAELRAILDTATDGVVTLDEAGRILSLNGAAEAVFGLDQNEVVGQSFTTLLRNESHAAALDYFEGLKANGVGSVLNDGREVFGREKKGGRIPLFMTLGQISEGEPRRFCAVLHDLTSWKRAEAELTEARRAAELASAKKSDFLTKISHEIRTPMNAIIGFAELMLEERLGPVGTPRYREYLGDIRTSGKHVVSLVNDLLDLAKIEAGRMELNFAATDLNAIVASAVGIIQPQANANRVLVRSQLATRLPPVVADERSVRQIVLNMLSNATRFTEAGGQVIVATALLESGEAVIRIRDTGIGMTANEIEQALEPFRQVGTRRDNSGTGLGLPLTKALVEANRANFSIRSTPGEGTLVEITFPSTRVLAE